MRVILATALVRVSAYGDREITVRALVDQGSESCFVSQNVIKLLRASRKPANVVVKGIGAVETEQVNSYAELAVRARFESSTFIHIKAFILKQVSSNLPSFNKNVKSFRHLKDLPFADEQNSDTRPIELILGAEIFSSILKSGVRLGRVNEPVAQETAFGWILSGRIVNRSQNKSKECTEFSSLHVTHNDNIEKQLRKFWEIEEVPSGPFLSMDDNKCEQIFRSTTIRKENGRYQVRIPFKTEIPDLGSSYQSALQQYHRLETRLNRDPSIAEQYNNFLKEYLTLGHMSAESSFINKPKNRYFLPHHPVIRESSSTTKLRVVFNASARSQNGNSLNHCMLTGPKLHQELFDIILRWRMHRFVCSADIEKMFRQILIHPDDTAYQCIIWRTPESNEIATYRLNTVTYGTAAAPYLSMRVLSQLAKDEAERFPNASAVLLRDTYVDDVVFGADTVEECRLIRNELIALLNSGGFPLRKWESNTEELLQDLTDELRARKLEKQFDDNSTKVLGIHWRRQDDMFSFNVKLQRPLRVTKRTILSIVASIFDPLGWVSPVVIIAKIFIKQLWLEKLDWDADLPDNLLREWETYFQDLSKLEQISLPRWTGAISNNRNLQIHGFADASEKAYAAVIYLRSETSQGPILTLLTSKTRVAPAKGLTIPRLELCAAVLLAELLSRVQQTLNFENIPCYCWSDSSIVLAWIRTCPSKLKRFVANRIWRIQEKIPGIEWRHVPTKSNPADIASRGSLPTELASHELWWHGPKWATGSSADWPQLHEYSDIDNLPEAKLQCLTAQISDESDSTSQILARFSSWPKLLRVTALIKRRAAISIAKRDPNKMNSESFQQIEPLHVFIQNASNFWTSYLQYKLFPLEIEALKQEKSVPNGKIKHLDPFLDENGLLRVGGRLQNAPLSYSIKHPLIIGPHYITKLIIRAIHYSTLHGGPQLMLRVLREKFWSIQARNQVRACVHQCVVCVRNRGAPCSQKMGNLPSDRVTPARAFSKTGVDYAGPFLTRALPGRGRTAIKSYVAVFVCLVTRAIHLELVSDLTSGTFLAAFRRFVSRYGLPFLVMSDNGTNFQGAERELRETLTALRKDENLASWFATEGVEWRFIPPNAPNFGGLWEAGVKSVKHHLKRVINNNTLTFEEMCTLLAQIGACLNSRPIAPMTDSIDDYSYLTPGHFLGCGLILSVPEPDLSDMKENRLSRWQRVQQMRDQFWRTWRADYLLQLQTRRKWQTESQNLTKGDIILIRSDLLPPCKWELGRVIECFPGKDNIVRVVKIKTAKSTFTRAVNKVCLLPLRSPNDKEVID